ncbi:MAG: PsiF family protein [Dokdonella sp.]
MAAPAKAMTPQQMKMGQCNKDATGKSGDERKMFMKTCLSAKSAMAAKPTQQQKMKTCNADAKSKALMGDTRKAYMKSCLSNEAVPAMQ